MGRTNRTNINNNEVNYTCDENIHDVLVDTERTEHAVRVCFRVGESGSGLVVLPFACEAQAFRNPNPKPSYTSHTSGNVRIRVWVWVRIRVRFRPLFLYPKKI